MVDPHLSGLDRAQIDASTTIRTGGQKKIDALNLSGKSVPVDKKKLLARVHDIPRNLRFRLSRGTEKNSKVYHPLQKDTHSAPILAWSPPNDKPDVSLGDPEPDVQKTPTVKDFLTHPTSTLKSLGERQGGNEFAQSVAQTDTNHDTTVHIVEVSDKLVSTKGTIPDDDDEDVRQLEYLKTVRQDAFVRWTVDRHIKMVGRMYDSESWQDKPAQYDRHVQLWKAHLERLASDDAWYNQVRDDASVWLRRKVEYYGSHYIKASDQLPEPSKMLLSSCVERIIISSRSLQNVFVRFRKIARWEYPRRSAVYMVVYFFLLYYDLLTPAILLYLFYCVMWRRKHSLTVDELRDDVLREEERSYKAKNLSEFISQHGTYGWMDAMIEEAGPTLLSQLEDLADLMEVLQNFYQWRDPRRTKISLCFLGLVAVFVALLPARLVIKSGFYCMGCSFFFMTPLAAYYPRYRQLTSPFTYLFWKVPTHADWAIHRLRLEAKSQIHDNNVNQVSGQSLPGMADRCGNEQIQALGRETAMSIGKYRCSCDGDAGHFMCTTEAISFRPLSSKNESWTIRYDEVKVIEKMFEETKTRHFDGLIFTTLDETQHRVSRLDARDEVFSQIIGYSNVAWRRIG